jgi:hypothetical protein
MAQGDRYPSNHRQIGYFCHTVLGDKHMGGILVTNAIGVPLEFKYTEPVTATKIHKILYGPVLEKHLHESVIRDRLASEVRTETEFFISSYEERDFLGPIGGREMMAVQKLNTVQADTNEEFTRIRDREAIVQLEDGTALRIAFSTSEESLQRKMASWIREIGRCMDALEPLDRITSALTALCTTNGKKL